MKARVYIETSVVSYLAARPSRDLIVAAHQVLTLKRICRDSGYAPPRICTPAELMGDE